MVGLDKEDDKSGCAVNYVPYSFQHPILALKNYSDHRYRYKYIRIDPNSWKSSLKVPIQNLKSSTNSVGREGALV